MTETFQDPKVREAFCRAKVRDNLDKILDSNLAEAENGNIDKLKEAKGLLDGYGGRYDLKEHEKRYCYVQRHQETLKV